MNELMETFIKSCVELGKEILDKENLTDTEEKFVENLGLVIDKVFKQ